MSDETKDKHTPEPWFLSGCDGCGDLWIETDKTPIASARSQGPTEELRAETKANARLIAAAPELLACLREVVNMAIAAGGLRGDDVQYGLGPADWIEGMDKAIKTIRKARG
jgi:hypothetical protein